MTYLTCIYKGRDLLGGIFKSPNKQRKNTFFFFFWFKLQITDLLFPISNFCGMQYLNAFQVPVCDNPGNYCFVVPESMQYLRALQAPVCDNLGDCALLPPSCWCG